MGLCAVRRRESVFGVLTVHVDIAQGRFAPRSLQTGVEGIAFVTTFQYVTVFFFILLLRGLERIHEYQTEVCSPGGSVRACRNPELEGTTSIVWPD